MRLGSHDDVAERDGLEDEDESDDVQEERADVQEASDELEEEPVEPPAASSEESVDDIDDVDEQGPSSLREQVEYLNSRTFDDEEDLPEAFQEGEDGEGDGDDDGNPNLAAVVIAVMFLTALFWDKVKAFFQNGGGGRDDIPGV